MCKDHRNYRVIVASLNNVIINTISGEEQLQHIWDMKINFNNIKKIISYNPDIILIVSNQPNIGNGKLIKRDFEFMMEYIRRAIMDYTGIYVEYSYCKFQPGDEFYRLPNPGMTYSLICRSFPGEEIDPNECLFVGHSDIDEKAAKQLKFTYLNL